MLCAIGLVGCASAPVEPPRSVVPHPTLAAADPAIDEARAEATWRAFLDQRQAYLDRLAEPLVACAERSLRDEASVSTACTTEDWPQLLQAAHALSRAYLHTRDHAHARAAELAAGPEVIEAARRDLHAHGVQADPYAYVWVLVAARTRVELTAVSLGDESLDALADEVAQGLETWLHTRPEPELARGMLLGAPNSVAWVTQNLWQWARARGDEALAARMQQFTAQRLLDEQIDQWCDLSMDDRPESFELFPPCLHRVLAVLTVMPQPEVAPWVRQVLEGRPELAPLGEAPLATHAALNFSRSWGLWALYRATGDAGYKRAYAEHIMTQMDTARWERLHEQDRAWVAEFGVYAIDMSYPVDSPAY